MLSVEYNRTHKSFMARTIIIALFNKPFDYVVPKNSRGHVARKYRLLMRQPKYQLVDSFNKAEAVLEERGSCDNCRYGVILHGGAVDCNLHEETQDPKWLDGFGCNDFSPKGGDR